MAKKIEQSGERIKPSSVQRTQQLGRATKHQITQTPEYKKAKSEYDKEVAKYEKEKAAYDKEVAEYERLLEENRQAEENAKAYNEAVNHFNKGMAGGYIYHMKKEAQKDPYVAKVRGYLQELAKKQKVGDISPRDSKLSSERRERSMKQKARITKEAKKLGIKTVGTRLKDLAKKRN